MERETKVINLIGAPGVGKTTVATELFSKMKWLGYSVELVSEYAKELVWEERNETIKNEVYIFGKQHHRFFRLKGKVDYIITDRPLILSCHYNNVYGDKSETFSNLVKHEVDKFENINFLLERTKEYVSDGRLQSLEESNQFSIDIEKMLLDFEIPFDKIKAEQGIVSSKIIDILKENK